MVPERVDTAFLAVGAYCGSGRPLNRLLLRNPQEMVFSGKRGLTAAEYAQRPALAGRRSRRIPRRLPQTRLKLSNPLLCSGQLPKCLRQRSLRLGQLAAQRGHQRSQDLIAGISITRHTRTLLPSAITHTAVRIIAAPDPAPANGATLKWS